MGHFSGLKIDGKRSSGWQEWTIGKVKNRLDTIAIQLFVSDNDNDGDALHNNIRNKNAIIFIHLNKEE